MAEFNSWPIPQDNATMGYALHYISGWGAIEYGSWRSPVPGEQFTADSIDLQVLWNAQAKINDDTGSETEDPEVSLTFRGFSSANQLLSFPPAQYRYRINAGAWTPWDTFVVGQWPRNKGWMLVKLLLPGAGVYTVDVMMRDEDGNTVTRSASVTVVSPPVVEEVIHGDVFMVIPIRVVTSVARDGSGVQEPVRVVEGVRRVV